MKHTFTIIFILLLSFNSKAQTITFPSLEVALVEDFTSFENFMPLLSLDLSGEGITDKIYVIFLSFNYNGSEVDNNFKEGESMGNYFYQINNDGKYIPSFKKGAMKIDQQYLPFFLKTKEKYQQLQRNKADVLSSIQFYDEPNWWQHDQTPFNSKGEKYTFICQFEPGELLGDDCCVYVFYDRNDKRIAYIHQYD